MTNRSNRLVPPMTTAEVRELLSSTTDGPLPMQRVFATLAEWEPLIEKGSHVATPKSDDTPPLPQTATRDNTSYRIEEPPLYPGLVLLSCTNRADLLQAYFPREMLDAYASAVVAYELRYRVDAFVATMLGKSIPFKTRR